jgi:ribonuclease P protein subunit RPR2
MKSEGATNKAKERVAILFGHAAEVFDEYPEIARRNIISARKMAMRYRIHLTKAQKMSFCKECNAYLKNGINSTVRLRHGKIVLKCKECGFVRRFGY